MGENFQELFARGYRARKENRIADSRAIFIKGVRGAAEEGDRPSLAEALCGLGQAERDIGNLEAARLHYAGAATLYREIGPPQRLAYAIRHEADVFRARGPGRRSRTTLPGSGKTSTGNRVNRPTLDLANTLRGLALVTESSAKPEASRSLWQEARQLYAKCNVSAGVAECDRNFLNRMPAPMPVMATAPPEATPASRTHGEAWPS